MTIGVLATIQASSVASSAPGEEKSTSTSAAAASLATLPPLSTPQLRSPASEMAAESATPIRPLLPIMPMLVMTPIPRRSEEHTSELQSLMRISYAVFCLKKKNTHTNYNLQLTIHIHIAHCTNSITYHQLTT